MSNSPFHLSLTVLLSVGLGYSLSSSTATGYPAGSAVSLGTNPVRSVGGNIDMGSTTAKSGILSAPSTHDLIVTDIVVGLTATNYDCDANGHLRLYDSSGNTFAEIPVYMSYMHNANTDPTTFQATSGIRIPANTTVNAQWTFAIQDCPSYNYDLRYTMGGYLAQP